MPLLLSLLPPLASLVLLVLNFIFPLCLLLLPLLFPPVLLHLVLSNVCGYRSGHDARRRAQE